MSDLAAIQAEKLMTILKANAPTEIGKTFDFEGISSVDEFRKQVPVMYDDYLLPMLERIINGEPNVLTTESPEYFGVTSGTTGKEKLIPVTASSKEDTRLHLRGWAASLAQNFKHLGGFSLLNLVNSGRDGVTDSGVPYGQMSHLFASMLNSKLHDWLPEACFHVKHTESRYYLILFCSLFRKVNLVFVINPSTLVVFCEKLKAYGPELLHQVRTGEFPDWVQVSDDLKQELIKRFPPNPQLADTLDAGMRKEDGLVPKVAWPLVQGIACWTGGSVGFFVDQLKDWFNQVPVFDLGYIATEGCFTIPQRANTPFGRLSLNACFFEFIPIENAEPDAAFPATLLAHELEPGKEYFILITGMNGLYRYYLNDIVQAGPAIDGYPEIAFVRKGGAMLSVTGEKVGEEHVLKAAGLLASELGTSLEGASAFVDMSESIPSYVFSIEFAEIQQEEAIEKLASRMDELMRQENSEYDFHRHWGRLRPCQVQLLPKGTYTTFNAQRAKANRGLQQKPLVIIQHKEDFEALMAVSENQI